MSEGLCWTKAADDLESIATVATTGTSGFQTAADQLLKLASLPDAMDTSAQESEAHSCSRPWTASSGRPVDMKAHKTKVPLIAGLDAGIETQGFEERSE